jgi:hypothetical protein
MDESKLVKDFQFDLWAALMIARSVPEPVATRLSSALGQALRQVQFCPAIAAMGAQCAEASDLVKASAFYAAEIARYQRIGRSINLQPE